MVYIRKFLNDFWLHVVGHRYVSHPGDISSVYCTKCGKVVSL